MDKKLISFKEAKEKLGVGTNVMLDLVHSEDFPSCRIGKKWYISLEGLDRWIESKCSSN